jgi:hypothetical protein
MTMTCANQKYFISRQRNWPDGDCLVEIAAGGRDYANPGMLAPRFPGEGEQYVDPLEAAKAALQIAEAWRRDMKRMIRDRWPRRAHFQVRQMIRDRIKDLRSLGVGYGATGGFTMPFSASDREELMAWATRRHEKLIRCDRCGDVIEGSGFRPFSMPDHCFCTEHCAEVYDSQFSEELDEDEEDH